MKKILHRLLVFFLILIILAGIGTACPDTETSSSSALPDTETETAKAQETDTWTETETETESLETETVEQVSFDASTVPAYAGTPYTEVNGNKPFFEEADLRTESFKVFSDLDSLGRCGTACACIGQDLLPQEERGSIGMIKPSGWHTIKYDNVDGNYLYNRCHLIAYELSGENANKKNLITGTRYMNVEGMEPFENMTADYIEETGNHVLYRVTPVFSGSNLVADGVLMEAESVEDRGEGILFCVYCYNVQPGISIDYATGDSQQTKTEAQTETQVETAAPETQAQTAAQAPAGTTYIVNTNTHKFHRPDCSSVQTMSEKNKWVYTGTRDNLIAQGYEPCKRCNP